MDKVNHFFIEIKENRSGFSIQSGKLQVVNASQYKKEYQKQHSIEDFMRLIQAAYSQCERKDGLIFIHGVWAYGRPLAYHLSQFERHIFQKPDSTIAFTLNIIWHTPPPSYAKSRKQCQRLAVEIAPVFWKLMDNLLKIKELDANLHLLCHSMGNYFFENLMESKPDYNEKVFNQIIMAAADVDVDFFSKQLPLMQALTQRVILLNNRHDVLLGVSRYLNQARRLGNAPPQYFAPFSPFVSATEIGSVRDVRNLIALGGQHIYYNASAKVMAYLGGLLKGENPDELLELK